MMKSMRFKSLEDITVEEIRELSEKLCKHHRSFPIRDGLSYFPDHHATGGDAPLIGKIDEKEMEEEKRT